MPSASVRTGSSATSLIVSGRSSPIAPIDTIWPNRSWNTRWWSAPHGTRSATNPPIDSRTALLVDRDLADAAAGAQIDAQLERERPVRHVGARARRDWAGEVARTAQVARLAVRAAVRLGHERAVGDPPVPAELLEPFG